MKIVSPKSDEAHIDHKVRVPIYILIFAIYLSRSQWVGEKQSKLKYKPDK